MMIAKVLGFAILVLLLVACDLTATQKEPGDGLSPTTPLVLSAGELAKEYERNPVRFRETYYERWLEVRGAPSSVDANEIWLKELPLGFTGISPTGSQPQRDDLILGASVGARCTFIPILYQFVMTAP